MACDRVATAVDEHQRNAGDHAELGDLRERVGDEQTVKAVTGGCVEVLRQQQCRAGQRGQSVADLLPVGEQVGEQDEARCRAGRFPAGRSRGSVASRSCSCSWFAARCLFVSY